MHELKENSVLSIGFMQLTFFGPCGVGFLIIIKSERPRWGENSGID